MIMEDIKRAISELEQESSLPAIGVELVDNELATLYMNSKKSEVKSNSPCCARSQTSLSCYCSFQMWLSTPPTNPLLSSLCRLISGIILRCCDRLCP